MARHHPEHPMRILIAPDTFKGSLAADQVAHHIAAGLLRAWPDSVITALPIADGGEGTAQTVAARLGATWHTAPVTDANGDPLDLPFAICNGPGDAAFAIFDVAEIVGLPAARVPVERRSTRGIGQAIRAIAAHGCTTIVLGLGGSSTNDAGAGLLAELAFDFDGGAIDPVLGNLHEIVSVTRRSDAGWLDAITLIGLTDVTSPLTGPEGASIVFGPQKGVADVAGADALLGSFGEKIVAAIGGGDFAGAAGAAGAGAAGGIGFAVRALGGTLQPGAAFILDTLQLDGAAFAFDWVITGEGRSDAQTLLGKGPAIVAALARRHGVPVTLLSGAVDDNADLFRAFDGCFSVQSAPVSLQYAMAHTGALLEAAAYNLARLKTC
ncbi:MAG: glycerate kinase [Pseudomonadota bacterium]|nr:glycerate kinase [Pseudomonadota bacterium]